MSQDIVADALNEIMNAKKAGKNTVVIKKHSRLLRNILEIVKDAGYIDYFVEDKKLKVEIKELNEIRAVKPRFTVSVKNIQQYTRRFLPAKNFGFIIISTNKGLMKGYEAEEKKIGGCLIAYIY